MNLFYKIRRFLYDNNIEELRHNIYFYSKKREKAFIDAYLFLERKGYQLIACKKTARGNNRDLLAKNSFLVLEGHDVPIEFGLSFFPDKFYDKPVLKKVSAFSKRVIYKWADIYYGDNPIGEERNRFFLLTKKKKKYIGVLFYRSLKGHPYNDYPLTLKLFELNDKTKQYFYQPEKVWVVEDVHNDDEQHIDKSVPVDVYETDDVIDKELTEDNEESDNIK